MELLRVMPGGNDQLLGQSKLKHTALVSIRAKLDLCHLEVIVILIVDHYIVLLSLVNQSSRLDDGDL